MELQTNSEALPEGASLVSNIPRLTADDKAILCLIYACKGEPVPEEVLGLLYEAAVKISSKFWESMQTLSQLGFLTSSSSDVAGFMAPPPTDEEPTVARAWSLWSELKVYMDSNMTGTIKEDVQGALDALLKKPCHEIEPSESNTERAEREKKRVASILCAWYFDPNHSDDAVRNAATLASTACFPEETIDVRQTVQPLIWLLYQPAKKDGRWTESNINCTRQVFLKYVIERHLDGANVSLLLKLSPYHAAPLAVLCTINRSFFPERPKTLLNQDLKIVVEALVDLLRSKDIDTRIQKAAITGLAYISYIGGKGENEESTSVFMNCIPSVLTVLVNAFRNSLFDASLHSNNLARQAALGLAFLSSGYQESILQQITIEAGAIECLVKSLSKHDHPILRYYASVTLAHLVYPDVQSIKIQLIKNDGAIAGLLSSLFNEKDSSVQENVGRALISLAKGEDSIKLQMSNEDGAIASLVKALYNRDNDQLLYYAPRILTNLSFGGDRVKLQVLKNDGVLRALVSSLSRDSNPDLQIFAAATLANLAAGRSDSIKLQLLNEPGTLASLVVSLSKSSNFGLQTATALTMMNLASGGGLIRLRILNEKGAFAGLVSCLSQDDNSDLQIFAAAALENLAAGSVDSIIKLLNEEGALASQVANSLSTNGNVKLQELTAAVVVNLAVGGDAIKKQILNEDGVLTSLVNALSQRDSPALRLNVQALNCLSQVEDFQMKVKMRNHDGLWTGLAMYGRNQDDLVLQKCAQEALNNLKQTLAEFP